MNENNLNGVDKLEAEITDYLNSADISFFLDIGLTAEEIIGVVIGRFDTRNCSISGCHSYALLLSKTRQIVKALSMLR